MTKFNASASKTGGTRFAMLELINDGIASENDNMVTYSIYRVRINTAEGYEIIQPSEYGKYFEPIFKNQTLSVTVKYVNSEAYELIRAADIIANRVLFEIEKGNIQSIEAENLCLRYFPYDR